MRPRIVVPAYHSHLTPDELISISTIRDSLSQWGICFVGPQSLNFSSIIQKGDSVERFDDDFFIAISGYNRLLMSLEFYQRFEEYSHILICQLDCLVFRDELSYWASRGFDYIAAPWFPKFFDDPKDGLWRVGNGGFSLRNVQSHLRVLKKEILQGYVYPIHGSRPWELTDPKDEVGLYQKNTPWYRRANPFAKWTTIEEELLRHPRNEDLFWAIEAPKFDPSFHVAAPEEALPFAFEMAPKWCYQKNGSRLPFGCHAWGRYDRLFWEEKIKAKKDLLK